jgi:HD superfamily phosphohydrolase
LLEQIGGRGFAEEIGALIVGRSTSPVAGLISGSLDLDKIDYLSRDAHMCGVPYGTVDVDRLLASLVLVTNERGGLEVGVHEKGVSALESLLFAKYQMYRNVYWHHAVRSATCMFKRSVRVAVAQGVLTHTQVREATDDGVMELLERGGSALARAVRQRCLYKRALELPASDVPEEVQDWVSEDAALTGRVEDQLAREVGLAPGELLLDFPARARMLSVDLLLRTRDGRTERLTDAGRAGQLGLPAVAEHLYRSARRLRIFVARPVSHGLQGVLAIVTRPADDVDRELRAGRALLERDGT